MKHNIATYRLFFGSLSNPNRLQIINVLRERSRNINDICKATGFERTMVSHNLKRLKRCGMIKIEQKGKFRYCSLNKGTIKPLMEIIDKHMTNYCRHVLAGRR